METINKNIIKIFCITILVFILFGCANNNDNIPIDVHDSATENRESIKNTDVVETSFIETATNNITSETEKITTEETTYFEDSTITDALTTTNKPEETEPNNTTKIKETESELTTTEITEPDEITEPSETSIDIIETEMDETTAADTEYIEPDPEPKPIEIKLIIGKKYVVYELPDEMTWADLSGINSEENMALRNEERQRVEYIGGSYVESLDIQWRTTSPDNTTYEGSLWWNWYPWDKSFNQNYYIYREVNSGTMYDILYNDMFKWNKTNLQCRFNYGLYDENTGETRMKCIESNVTVSTVVIDNLQTGNMYDNMNGDFGAF